MDYLRFKASTTRLNNRRFKASTAAFWTTWIRHNLITFVVSLATSIYHKGKRLMVFAPTKKPSPWRKRFSSLFRLRYPLAGHVYTPMPGLFIQILTLCRVWGHFDTVRVWRFTRPQKTALFLWVKL